MPFGKEQQQPYIENNVSSKENQIEVDFTSFEEVTRIPWVMSMEKEVISEKAITVGCNGPTKQNVTLEGIFKDGILKDIKQNLLQNF